MLRKEKLALWVERCEAQIAGVLAMLEQERAAVATPYWFGKSIGHADIAVACALRFIGEAHPALFDARYPGAQGAFRALRSAAGISGNRAAARAAEGVTVPSPIEVGFIRLRHIQMPNSGKPELGWEKVARSAG